MKRRLRRAAARAVGLGLPLGLLTLMTLPVRTSLRAASALALGSYWTLVYLRYRRHGVRRTKKEFDLLAATDWEVYWRHYNEEVPTIDEEFEIWGPYHQHRHELRYDLVADVVRRHLPPGGRVFDLGSGSANVADRLTDLDALYIGMDFGQPMVEYAKKKLSGRKASLGAVFLRGDGAQLPLAQKSCDVVVMSEVIEHLTRPELAVWEVSRILKPGGVFVMTTNNASEMPLRSPLSHLFVWIEKALGASVPGAISYRPWIWPRKMSSRVVPEGSPDVYLPHTHHIQAETRRLFSSAGLDTFRWSTFEFPPPQSATAGWLERRGRLGLRLVDMLEAMARITPGISRLGTHVMMVARKVGEPVEASPPPGVWPGRRLLPGENTLGEPRALVGLVAFLAEEHHLAGEARSAQGLGGAAPGLPGTDDDHALSRRCQRTPFRFRFSRGRRAPPR
jgi:SAM-dependent methyltransferase